MKTKASGSPEAIGALLRPIVARLDPGGHFEAARLASVWPETVGPEIARRTEVSALKFHTAIVKVSNAMWIQELNLMRREILERLVARMGNDSVRELRFVRGPLSRRSARPRLASREPRRAVELPELPNAGLREAFERLIEAWGRAPR